jgi:hypothetical protein
MCYRGVSKEPSGRHPSLIRQLVQIVPGIKPGVASVVEYDYGVVADGLDRDDGHTLGRANSTDRSRS